ncbi:hypothetical protein [Flavobacterium sp.]|uniref:hypothetical protein n=1 Tax=Flavobacterium sp. TaxID=239 RepID=UPI00374CB1A0
MVTNKIIYTFVYYQNKETLNEMKSSFKEIKEIIHIEGNAITMGVSVFEVKDGDFYVCIAPALLVSGYGDTMDEARKSFIDNIDFFCEALTKLTNEQKETELVKLGFVNENQQNTDYSKAYIDQNGVLQGFDFGSVKTSRMEVTV